MRITIVPEKFLKAVEEQGDTPDPAPYLTARDVDVLGERRAERERREAAEAARHNGNGNGAHPAGGTDAVRADQATEVAPAG